MTLLWKIDQYDCVESTQDILKKAAIDGAHEGLVVCAKEQAGGRGRHGNIWNSPKGNLYFSFLLKPNGSAENAGQYSFLVAVALSRTIEVFISAGHSKHLKWPNDIIIDDKKCAGILLESAISAQGIVTDLYVGVGVNIYVPPEEAISINDVSDQDVTIDIFLNTFLKNIEQLYEKYNKNGFKCIRTEWMKEAYKISENIHVRLPNKTLYGVFEGLDKDGTLLLRLDNDTLQRITAGEVYF